MDSSPPQRRGRQSYNAIQLRGLASFDQSREMEKRELPPSLVKRIPDSTTSSGSSSSSCVSSQGSNTCEKPATLSAALPIALGVCVPIAAIIVFIFLHRQYRKRLRREDKADAEKYKSMDFGMDINYNGGKGGKKGKKGADADLNRPPPHMRGLSLDPAHSPFFLNGPNPAKTFSDSDSIYEDRYHGIGPGMGSRAGSRSNSPMPRRVATNHSDSTMSPSFRHDADAKLLHNAQGNPTSLPPRSHSIPQVTTSDPFAKSETSITAPEPAKTRDGGLAVPAKDATRDSYFEKNAQQIRRSNNYLASFFQPSEPTWDEKTDRSSPPSSHVHSASSTVLDSGSQGTKTPMTSMSDTDSSPPMPSSKQLDFESAFSSPTTNSNEFAEMNSKLQSDNMSPEPQASARGRMPLRLGMPASDEHQEYSQHSVEYKVSAPEQSRHKSFDASLHDLHISVVSAATSNLTDILNTPRDSTYPPPVPNLPPSRDESIASPRRSDIGYESYTTKEDTSTAPTSPMKSANHGYDFNFSRGDSFAGSMAESVYDDKYDQAYPMEDPYGLHLAEDDYPDFPTHDSTLGSPHHADELYDQIPPRGQSLAAAIPMDGNQAVIPPRGESLVPSISFGDEEDYDSVLDIEEYGNPEVNRLSVLMRPLPPDDPTETPEVRANRIRSFYKEYFDDSQVHTSQRPLPSQAVEYHEDYRSEFQGGGTLYDSKQNGFVVAAPFAEPVTRRAMTPPPRAPPRFDTRNRSRAGSAAGPMGAYPPRGPSSMSNQAPRGRSPLPPRNPSSMSGYLSPRGPGMSKFPPRGPSAMSNMSNMSGRSHASRRPKPPPQPLMSLPTPSQLKDDAALFTASDFAPPLSYRDRQNGRRPESPMGAQRPYSPAVRAFVPLNSSFDNLTSIPSPHMLRKSGAFNTLDFTPPPRFKNVDSGSDASSIRSGRSNMSASQLGAMRAGAYRMSRLPAQLAGTKQDIMAGLRPQWDMSRPG